MSGTSLFYIAGVVVLGTAVGSAITTWRRHQKDYRKYLAPELQRHGLQFVSARYPGAFRVGPFPIIEPRANRHLQTNIGSFVEFRVVRCTDDTGNQFTVWAQLDFAFYMLQRLSWRAEPRESLPDSAKGLIEN